MSRATARRFPRSDDHFAVGLKITRGAVKILWKGLEEADVVVASPLGVATALQESIQEKGEGKIDWLTSVEVGKWEGGFARQPAWRRTAHRVLSAFVLR